MVVRKETKPPSFLVTTTANIDRFSEFLYCHTQQ